MRVDHWAKRVAVVGNWALQLAQWPVLMAFGARAGRASDRL